MRVVDPHQHPQQRGGPGHGQRDRGEAGPQHGEPHGQPSGQSGVVARERPVPRAGAFRHGFGTCAQRTAGPLLVHDELHRFARRIGHDGAETGQDGTGDPSCVFAAHRRPPHPGQQHSEDHQRALGGHLQKRAQPRRRIRHRPGHRPVRGRRSPTRDLHGPSLTQPTGRQPRDDSCSHAQDGRRAEQPTGAGFHSRFSFHGART